MGVILGGVVFYLSYTRFKYQMRWCVFLYLFFLGVVGLLVTTTQIFYLFVYYELLFLPSFVLVYLISPNRRSIFASTYFFFWTQGGSLLVLVGFLAIYSLTGLTTFDHLSSSSLYLSAGELNLLGLCCLVGFGVKIPM
jgi:formate hydrogenlyase subunit 3/multisubunit Na+/H+ antiporter MnhD subunit